METIRFHITVKGIVVFEQKVLLMKRIRPSSDGLGYWELPGGGLNYGETPDQALIRELKEETGLDISVVKPAYTFSKIRTGYQTVGIGYLALCHDCHVVLSDEHQDYLWCDINHLQDYLCEEIYNDIIYTINEYYK